jgi:hypothetical protein
MKYYSIGYDQRPKITGRNAIQCKGMPDKYNLDWLKRPSSHMYLSNDNYPKNDPCIVFELEENSKLTDIISYSMISSLGLLINEKVFEILKTVKVSNSRFYDVELICNNKIYKYYYLHFVETSLRNIDFVNSKLFKSSYTKKIEDVNVVFNEKDFLSRVEDYRKIHELNCLLKFSSLSLKENFDCFYLPYQEGIFISETLKIKFEEQNISGLTFHSNLNEYIMGV